MVRMLMRLGVLYATYRKLFMAKKVTCCTAQGIRFVLLLSRQGKVRLAKWYTTYTQKERSKARALDVFALEELLRGCACECLLRTVTGPAPLLSFRPASARRACVKPVRGHV